MNNEQRNAQNGGQPRMAPDIRGRVQAPPPKSAEQTQMEDMATKHLASALNIVSVGMTGTVGVQNVEDHYWVIGGSTTEVYQSKSNTKVSVTNADFIEWQQTVYPLATPIGTEAELAVVLQQRASPLPSWLLNTQPTFVQPAPNTYTKPQLKAYDADARWRKEQGGYKTSWAMLLETNDRSQAKVNGARLLADSNNQYTTKWHASDGVVWTLTNAQIKTLSNELQAHINKCFIISADNVSKIDLGTMTTLAQIDAAYTAYNPMAGGPPPV